MDPAHVFHLVLTGFAVYVVGISLMTTVVSYPLYASVPADAFVAYHAHYHRQIRAVVIAPAFATFLGCAAYPFLRPDGAPGWAALLVALGGLTALAATVSTAIPAHGRLQRDGFTPVVYRRLRVADTIRTFACLLSAAALIVCTLVVLTPR